MSLATIIVGAVGLIASGVSSYVQYDQSRKAADSATDTANRNAAATLAAARQEREAEAAKMRDTRRKMARRKAAIEAAYAKSGVLLEGTPAQALTEQVASDAAEMSAWGSDVRRRGYEMQHAASMGIRVAGDQSGAIKAQADSTILTNTVNTAVSTGSWMFQNR